MMSDSFPFTQSEYRYHECSADVISVPDGLAPFFSMEASGVDHSGVPVGEGLKKGIALVGVSRLKCGKGISFAVTCADGMFHLARQAQHRSALSNLRHQIIDSVKFP